MGSKATAWQQHHEYLRNERLKYEKLKYTMTLESRAHPGVRTWQQHGRMVGTIGEGFAYLEQYRRKGRDVRIRNNGALWIERPGIRKGQHEDDSDT